MFGTGVPTIGLFMLVLLGFLIATTVNTFAMEAAVLFVPAFLFVFPLVVPGFPALAVNAAVGLALFVELFGYSSSVAAYWYRHQIDFKIASKVLVITIPVAMLARVGSYYVPGDALMLGFGGLLLLLSVILYEAHEHGPSIVVELMDRVPDGRGRTATDRILERPELSLFSAVLHEDYEPRTRLTDDTHDAGETPPGDAVGGPAESEAKRGNGTAYMGDSDDEQSFHLELLDVLISILGGALAGLVGIAIGELTQAMLTLRRRVPLKLSTGTSALILHVTIISALVMNVGLLRFAPSITGEGFTVPFNVGIFVAMGCLFGGQAGAYLNNKLEEKTVMMMLIAVYFLVGMFVVFRVLFLAGGGH